MDDKDDTLCNSYHTRVKGLGKHRPHRPNRPQPWKGRSSRSGGLYLRRWQRFPHWYARDARTSTVWLPREHLKRGQPCDCGYGDAATLHRDDRGRSKCRLGLLLPRRAPLATLFGLESTIYEDANTLVDNHPVASLSISSLYSIYRGHRGQREVGLHPAFTWTGPARRPRSPFCPRSNRGLAITCAHAPRARKACAQAIPHEGRIRAGPHTLAWESNTSVADGTPMGAHERGGPGEGSGERCEVGSGCGPGRVGGVG